MSQVRKLLQGKLIPKAQEGYKFRLDSQDYTVTDDQLKEIDNLISTLDPKHRRFLGNWTNAIKEGNAKGNRASNTVTMNMLTNIGGRDETRLKKQKGSFWETIGEKDSYYAKEAIGEALSITASVLNRVVPKQVETPSKTKISNSNIDLDFNDGVFSLTAGENLSAKNRIKQIIEHIAAGDNSKYDVSDWNNLDAIKVLLESNPNYADEMWERMSKPGYKYSAEDEDFLRNFGINYNFAKQTTPVGGGAPVVTGSGDSTKPANADQNVGDLITVGDKNYRVVGIDEDGKINVEEVPEGELEQTPQEEKAQSTPRLVLIQPGERDDMDWGVYYNGVPYAYESIQPGSELGNLMAMFEENNKRMWSQGERYNANAFIKMPSIKNFADWTVGQTLEDGTDLNPFFLNKGITSAAVSHIATDAEGNRYFKYYNNFNPYGTYVPQEGNTPKQTPWGIRNPYYLMIDKNGNITALSSEPTAVDFGVDNAINQAPKFKGLWNPNTAALSGYKTSTNGAGITAPPHQDNIPATFIGEVVIDDRGNIAKLYRLKDGSIYINADSIGKNATISLEELYKRLNGMWGRWGKDKKPSKKQTGGTISKSKTDAFKGKFGGATKAQDGIVLPKIKHTSAEIQLLNEIAKERQAANNTTIAQIIRSNDENGNPVLITRKLENPIPDDIAATVAEPIKVESNNLDEPESAESVEKTVVVKPENFVEIPEISNYEPITFNDVRDFSNENALNIPVVPLAKQKILPLKTNKKKNFNDLVSVLEQLIKHKKGGVIKAQAGLQFNLKNLGKGWTLIDNSGIDENIIAYRPGVDWGTYVGKDGMGYYTSVGDISPAPMYYTKPEAYYMGAREAIAEKIKNEIDPKSPKPDLNYYKYQEVNPSLAEENEEVLPEDALKSIPYVDPTKTVGMKLESGLKNPTAYEMSDEEPSIRRISSLAGDNTEDIDEGGGYPKNISGYHKYLIPALSLARFGLNAHFQNKYRKQAIDALNAGRFNETATWANLPRQDSPALDRQLQQIRSERMTGIKPVTSDLIANSALQNEREAKLYDRENEVIGKQSQFEWNAAKEALDIMNHNIANQVAVTNSNRARNASINSAIKQQDLMLTQRRAQSWENLGLEIQNNLKKDRDVMLNYGKAQEQARLQKEYDRTIDQIFGSQVRNEYNSLSADEAANYTDYDDYLNKKYNSIYRQNIERINKAQETRVNEMRRWLYLNGLNYSYPTFITGKSSPYGYKKGGYLRGSTRYTLEPDERIWIDNNRATHQAIAKLSDNTIKLLLRALK